MIILLNVIAAVAAVCGGVILFLSLMYQNYSEIPYIALGAIICIPLVLFISFYFLHKNSHQVMWGLLPILYVVSLFILLPFLDGFVESTRIRYIDRTEEKIPSYLEGINKDFTCSLVANSGRKDFITIDNTEGVAVYITSGNGFVRPSLLGRLSGNKLEMFYAYSQSSYPYQNSTLDIVQIIEKYHELFNSCVNNQGKSIFDLYDINYVGPAEVEKHKIRQYETYRDPSWMQLDLMSTGNYVGSNSKYYADGNIVLTTGIPESSWWSEHLHKMEPSRIRSEILTRFQQEKEGKANTDDLFILTDLLFSYEAMIAEQPLDSEIKFIKEKIQEKYNQCWNVFDQKCIDDANAKS